MVSSGRCSGCAPRGPSRDQEPPEWRDATGLSQAAMWLTADEAQELLARQHELFLTHAERIRAPRAGPTAPAWCRMVGWLVPSGPHQLPKPQPDERPQEGSR